jgi:2'-5' RNA ligase
MIRAFLAIDLPGDVRARLERDARTLRDRLHGWRWADVHGIHLTLRFLGEVEPEALARARPRWMDAIGRLASFEFRVAGLGTFPAGGRPRVLWAGVDGIRPSGALASLVGAIDDVARELGPGVDDRPFRPHLTLARARRDRKAERPRGRLALDAGRVDVREATLFRSTLSRDGASYTVLARFPLDPGRPTA